MGSYAAVLLECTEGLLYIPNMLIVGNEVHVDGEHVVLEASELTVGMDLANGEAAALV